MLQGHVLIHFSVEELYFSIISITHGLAWINQWLLPQLELYALRIMDVQPWDLAAYPDPSAFSELTRLLALSVDLNNPPELLPSSSMQSILLLTISQPMPHTTANALLLPHHQPLLAKKGRAQHHLFRWLSWFYSQPSLSFSSESNGSLVDFLEETIEMYMHYKETSKHFF
jgi:hypothetical protein